MTPADPLHRETHAATSAGDFLGIPLFGGSVDDFLAIVEAWQRDSIDRRTDGSDAEAVPTPGRIIAYLNAHTTNMAFTLPAMRRALARAHLIYADGMAVVWAARHRGLAVKERVNAADFFAQVAERALNGGWRVALVGGSPGEAEAAGQRLAAAVPGFAPVFAHHGYFAPDEIDAIAAGLVEARATIVLVGMGSPLQEITAARLLQACQRLTDGPAGTGAASARSPAVWWCVGALFEYYAGTRRRAPAWMCRMGLEWLMRLLMEPQRMWRRYLLGNVAFVARTLRGRPAPPPGGDQ